MTGIFTWFVLGALAVAGLAVYAYIKREQRRDALAGWARSHGLSFNEEHDHSIEYRFGNFDCLQEGHDRYAYNVITGDWRGRKLTAFDYHYETGSGDDETTHRISAVVLQAPCPLKPLAIRPERFFDRVSAFFGFDDIDFESAEFSREFYVKATDRKWAYDVIHARMMEYLLAAPRYFVQFGPIHVIAWADRTFEPNEFHRAAEFIRGLLDRLPEYLIRKQTDGA
jgi:hypothetical protein